MRDADAEDDVALDRLGGGKRRGRQTMTEEGVGRYKQGDDCERCVQKDMMGVEACKLAGGERGVRKVEAEWKCQRWE